jgi:putative transposase
VALIGAFNSKMRCESPITCCFLSPEGACEKRDLGRRHYNEERPHGALGDILLIMVANPIGATSPPNSGRAENSRPERPKVG